MANEISLTLSGSVYKSSTMTSAKGRSVTGAQFTMAGNYTSEGTMLVGTSATAIPLGQVTQPHWAWFSNCDATNYVTLRNGSTGADLCKLKAGESCWIPLHDSAVPYAVANTASVLLEFLVISL